MFIGSKSDNTILDVFKIGFTELVRQSGIPEELRCKTAGCEMETIRAALSAAETGHLVFSTLHTLSAVDTDMKTFDQHAVELHQAGLISQEEAISAGSNEEGFHRIISGIKSSEGRKLLK